MCSRANLPQPTDKVFVADEHAGQDRDPCRERSTRALLEPPLSPNYEGEWTSSRTRAAPRVLPRRTPISSAASLQSAATSGRRSGDIRYNGPDVLSEARQRPEAL